MEVKGNIVVVDYGRLGRAEAQNIISARVGDYVYVTQKFVTNIIPEEEALAVLKSL